MTQYVIRLAGSLTDELATAFPPLRLTVRRGGITVLQGELSDQGALARVLEQLDVCGVRILAFARTLPVAGTEELLPGAGHRPGSGPRGPRGDRGLQIGQGQDS
jgi:hypothetical protein